MLSEDTPEIRFFSNFPDRAELSTETKTTCSLREFDCDRRTTPIPDGRDRIRRNIPKNLRIIDISTKKHTKMYDFPE